AARQQQEPDGRERHVEREQQREQRLVRPHEGDQVERIAERGQAERHALVDVRVPEAQLSAAQPLEREAPQRKEVERQVAEVEARSGQHAAREGQEGDERHERRGRPLALPLGAHVRPQVTLRTTRAGTPATSVPAGTSAVTTLPAATNERAPIRMPGRSVAAAPTNEPCSITTGAAIAGNCACSGWSW